MRRFTAALLLSLCCPLLGAAQLRIATSADSLVFPTTKIGFSRDRSVRLTNISQTTVNINSLSVVPFFAAQYEFDIYTPTVPSFSLDSGEGINLIVRFKPESAGFHSAALVIETDEGEKLVNLYSDATLLEPEVHMNPLVLDFGTLAPGESKDMTFQMASAGLDIATVDFIEMENDDGAVFFDATPADPRMVFPLPIRPQDTAKFTARFNAFGPNGKRSGRAVMEGLVTGQITCEFKGRVGWPDLAFNPQVIDLGVVVQGTSVDTFATIYSVGESPVYVTQVSPPVAPYSISGVPPFPLGVIPGGSIRIGVHFDAIGPGIFQDKITALAKPVSVYLLNSTAFLKATVIPRVLSHTSPERFIVSCAVDSDYEHTFTISDTGQYPISISGISFSDDRFGATYPLSFPDTLYPGNTRDIVITFKSKGHVGDTNCIVTLLTGSTPILTDTIHVLSFEDRTKLQLVTLPNSQKKLYVNEAGILSLPDFGRFGLTSLEMNMAIDPPDVAEIDTINTKIDDTIFPNATITVHFDPILKAYHAEIHSLTPLPASPLIPFVHIPLHYFVSRDSTAWLHITDVHSSEKEECVIFSDDSMQISSEGSCGDPEIRNLLNAKPLFSELGVTPNPSETHYTTASFMTSENILASLAIIDISGETVFRSDGYFFQKGKQFIRLDLSSLSSGTYLFRLSGYSQAGQWQNISSVFILKR